MPTLRVLLLADSPTQDSAAPVLDQYPTSSRNLPNLLNYEVILVRVPEEPLDPQLVEELTLASKAGRAVALLLNEHSKVESVAELVGAAGKHFALRTPARSSTVLNGPYAFYLKEVPFSHLFEVERPNRVLAHAGEPSIASAVVVTQSRRGTLAVLPENPQASPSEYRRLARQLHDERDLGSIEIPLGPLYRLAIYFLIAALAIVVVRFSQKQSNWRILYSTDPNPIRVHLPDVALLNEIGSLSLEDVRLLYEPGQREAPVSVQRSIVVARALGAVYSEREIVKAEMKRVASGTGDGFALKSYAEDSLPSDIRSFAEEGQFELARFSAQMFLDIQREIPASSLHHTGSRNARFARKVLSVLSRNYLYQNRSKVEGLLRLREGDRDSAGPGSRGGEIHPSLSDDLVYDSAVLACDGLRVNAADECWAVTATALRDGWLREQAEFNRGRARLLSLGSTAPSGHRLAVARFREFVSTYPDSYLADDALYFLVRLLSAENRPREAWVAYGRLLREYGTADSTKRLTFLVRNELVDLTGDWRSQRVAEALTEVAGSGRLEWPIDSDVPDLLPERLGPVGPDELLAILIQRNWPELR